MVELDPAFKSQNGDEVLRSIEEWMVQQARAAKTTNQTADKDNCGPGKGTPFSPGIAPPEPSIEPPSSGSPDRPIEPSQQAKNSTSASNELKRMVRVMVGVLLVGVVLGAVWQTYRDEQTRNLIKDWRHSSMSWLSYSFSATQRDSESSAQSSTKLSDQAAQRPTGASVQADEVADLKQQLLAVVNDLAIMRRDVEQISSKHEQLSRDIAAVQATEQNVSEKISSLTQPAPTLTQPARGQPRKNVPKVVRAESPKQPDAASVPPKTPPTGTESLTEQPPRPPLPVPTAAETPPPLH